MKHIIILLSIISCFFANAELNATFNHNPAQQVFSGHQPNDVPTSKFLPNVGVQTTATIGGIYSAIGFDMQCEGEIFPQKWAKGDGTGSKNFNLQASTTVVQNYENWPSGDKTCHLVWAAETIGTKTTSGTSITFTLGGEGFNFSISTNSTMEPPDVKKREASSKLFRMIKEQPNSGSGSSGGNC